MRYLDTNILVRLITGDDRRAAEAALKMVDAADRASLFVHDCVLTEICFVLEFGPYKMKRVEIVKGIRLILDAPQTTYDDRTPKALDIFEKHRKLDFTDCLLIVHADGDKVETFDKEIIKFQKSND